MYFVTVLNRQPKRKRCWGYYSKYEDAFQAVKENWTDIYECGYYDLAVIEKLAEGVAEIVLPEDAVWFDVKYDHAQNKYEVSKLDSEPEEFKQTFNFCLG